MSKCDHYFVTRTDRVKRFCHKCNLEEGDELIRLRTKVEELEKQVKKLGDYLSELDPDGDGRAWYDENNGKLS